MKSVIPSILTIIVFTTISFSASFRENYDREKLNKVRIVTSFDYFFASCREKKLPDQKLPLGLPIYDFSLGLLMQPIPYLGISIALDLFSGKTTDYVSKSINYDIHTDSGRKGFYGSFGLIVYPYRNEKIAFNFGTYFKIGTFKEYIYASTIHNDVNVELFKISHPTDITGRAFVPALGFEYNLTKVHSIAVSVIYQFSNYSVGTMKILQDKSNFQHSYYEDSHDLGRGCAIGVKYLLWIFKRKNEL